ARDRGRLPAHLQVRGHPALDVGAVRRRVDRLPAQRLRGQGADHLGRPPRPGGRPVRQGAAGGAAGGGGLGGVGGTGSESFEELTGAASDRFETPATDPDTPAQLYYTSGTTGLAKGILHAHRYLLGHEEFQFSHDVRAGELFHSTGEWAWIAGIVPGILGPWASGGETLVHGRKGGFDPGKALRLIADHGVGNLFTTPTAIRAMMGVSEAAGLDFGHPRPPAGPGGACPRPRASAAAPYAGPARPASRSTQRRSPGGTGPSAARCST